MIFSDAEDYAIQEATVVATGPTGGGVVMGSAEFDVDLGGAKRFIKPLITPDLSAGATDTADLSGVFVFGGGPIMPS